MGGALAALGAVLLPATVMSLLGSGVPPLLRDSAGFLGASLVNLGPPFALLRTWKLASPAAAPPEALLGSSVAVGARNLSVAVATLDALAVLLAVVIMHQVFVAQQRQALRHAASMSTSGDWSILVSNLPPSATEVSVAEHFNELGGLERKSEPCGSRSAATVRPSQLPGAVGAAFGSSSCGGSPSPAKQLQPVSCTASSGREWLRGGWVADVVIGYDVADAIRRSRKMASTLQRRRFVESQLAKYSPSSPWHQVDKFHAMVSEGHFLDSVIEQWKTEEPHFTGVPRCAVVTFNHQESRQQVLQAYANSFIPCCLAGQGHRLRMQAPDIARQAGDTLHRRMHAEGCDGMLCGGPCPWAARRWPLVVVEAPAPSDLLWEHVGGSKPRACARFLLVLGCLVALFSLVQEVTMLPLTAARSAGTLTHDLDTCQVRIPAAALADPFDLPGAVRYRGNTSVAAATCSKAFGGGLTFVQLEAEVSPALGWLGRHPTNASQVLEPARRQDGCLVRPSAPRSGALPAALAGPDAFLLPLRKDRDPRPTPTPAPAGSTLQEEMQASVRVVEPALPQDASASQRLVFAHPCTGFCMDLVAPAEQQCCSIAGLGALVPHTALLRCFCQSQLSERIAIFGTVEGIAAFKRATDFPTMDLEASELFAPARCKPDAEELWWLHASTWLVAAMLAGLGAIWSGVARLAGALLQPAFVSRHTWRRVAMALAVTGRLLATWGGLVLARREWAGGGPGSPVLDWHAASGVVIHQTIVIQCVMAPVLLAAEAHLRPVFLRQWRTSEPATQQDLEDSMMPPQFEIDARLAFALSIFVTCFGFAASFPVLPFVGAGGLWLLLLAERVALTRGFRGPSPVDGVQLAACATGWTLPFAVALHVAWAFMLLTNGDQFPSDASDKAPGTALAVRAAKPEGILMASVATALCLAWGASRVAPDWCSRVSWLLSPRCLTRHSYSRRAPGFDAAFAIQRPPFTERARFELVRAVDPALCSALPPGHTRAGWRLEKPTESAGSESPPGLRPGSQGASAGKLGEPASMPESESRFICRVWPTDAPDIAGGATAGDPMMTWQSLADRDAHFYALTSTAAYRDAQQLLIPVMRRALGGAGSGSRSARFLSPRPDVQSNVLSSRRLGPLGASGRTLSTGRSKLLAPHSVSLRSDGTRPQAVYTSGRTRVTFASSRDSESSGSLGGDPGPAPPSHARGSAEYSIHARSGREQEQQKSLSAGHYDDGEPAAGPPRIRREPGASASQRKGVKTASARQGDKALKVLSRRVVRAHVVS